MDDMELYESRMEGERLRAAAWGYEHRRPWKSSLPKWLFTFALLAAVPTAYDFSDIYSVITSATGLAETKQTFDAAGAANVAEDLDYSIAQRAKSLQGWYAFLEVHPDGPHTQAAHAEIERLLTTPPPQPDAHGNGVYAQAARAEVEKTLPAEKVSPPGAAPEDSYNPSTGAEPATDVVDRAAARTEVAALTPREICKHKGDRLERLRSSPKNDEAARFANELGCEKLRPQLLPLMESLHHAPSVPAVAAHQRPSAGVGSALSQEPRLPVRPDKTRWTALHTPQPRLHANRRRIVDRRTQYVVTMWLDCPVEETGDRTPGQGCLLLERP
jgi:hypothetical protein